MSNVTIALWFVIPVVLWVLWLNSGGLKNRFIYYSLLFYSAIILSDYKVISSDTSVRLALYALLWGEGLFSLASFGYRAVRAWRARQDGHGGDPRGPA